RKRSSIALAMGSGTTPFRLIHFVLAYVIGLVLYAVTHKYSPEYVKSRVRNVLVVLWIVILE
ncbi:hypothetical protein, partial [Serratia marcescens]|uniref:hypothetical protein n=1 Tax=Serratia marcescens TaxID=615 RepID=UPI001953D296